MALSLNQAQDIVQKLSNDQLMQAYTSGTVPQFVVFSEMQRRQSMANSQAKMPTQTVAEKMVGAPEQGGIAQMMPEPQMAARGGQMRANTLDMGYSEDLPPEAKKIISMRMKAMQELESNPDYLAEGSDGEPVQSYPVNSREIADMLLNPVKMTESNGRQSAVSPKGARGVMQIMPGTGPEAARLAGLPWDYNKYAKDEGYNTKLGHAYLTSMIDRFGDTEKALAAYNWGPTNLSKALIKAKQTGTDWKSFLPGETSAYIGKVLGQNQAYLPQRQEAEGADTQVPEYSKPYTDVNFAGSKGSDPSIYSNVNKYPYERGGLDSLRSAFGLASNVQKMKFNSGGPVYLQAGGTSDESSGSGNIKSTPYGNVLTLPNGEEVIIPPGMSPADAKRMFSRTPMSTSGANTQSPTVSSDSQFIPEKIYSGTKDILGRVWDSLPSRQEVGEGIDRFGQSVKKVYDDASAGAKKLEGARTATPSAPYTASNVGLPGIGDDESYVPEEPTSSIAGRAIEGWTEGASNWLKGTDKQHALAALMEERDSYGIGLFEQLTDSQRAERERKVAEIDAKIKALKDGETKTQPAEKTGIVSIPNPSQGGGPAGTEPPVPPQGIPAAPGARPPGVTPTASASGGAGVPRSKATASADGDSSFSSVYGEIQKAIGPRITDAIASSEKEHKERIASMKNDKLADTLFAAAKTLASQRVGSVNYADVVANAGFAAQVAQKRIYDSEDNMRKYKADFLKAQADGDYKAANIAMSRINNEETNRRSLQTAMMQTSKMLASQENSERKANIASATRLLVEKESNLDNLNKMILDPGKFGITDVKGLEIERDRLQNQINGYKAQLNYFQGGKSMPSRDAVIAEARSRGLIP